MSFKGGGDSGAILWPTSYEQCERAVFVNKILWYGVPS